MSSPLLNSDGWNPALPISVQLRDHDGDIKMQPFDLELSKETADVVESIFQLDINIDRLFGDLDPTTQVHHQFLNVSTTNVQHTAPSAPAFPPGLDSSHVPHSNDNTGHHLPVPQPRGLNTHVINNVVPVPFSSPAVDVEMTDAFSFPAVANKASRRKKFSAPRPRPYPDPKSRRSRVRFVAALDTGQILPETFNVSEPVPVVCVERTVDVS